MPQKKGKESETASINRVQIIKMKTIITFGTYSLPHFGHVRILERARALGDRLVVGVSSDALNMKKKGRTPIMSQEHRMAIVAALRCVDEVFLEESLELKKQYIKDHNATVLAMGDDWAGKFDGLADEVVYFKRTPGISTTELIEKISNI